MVLSQERERLQIYETVGSDGERSFLCADLFIVSRRKKGKKKKEKSFTVIVNVAPENSASLWLWKKKTAWQQSSTVPMKQIRGAPFQ